MDKFTSCSNQRAFGVAFRICTIYGSNRYSFSISYGFNTTCWSWKRNPPKPLKKTEMTTLTKEQVIQCDDIRESFERIFKEPPFEFSLELYGEHDAWPGSYKKYYEQCAWTGYQEAWTELRSITADMKDELEKSESDIIAKFLERSGKWLVNDAILKERDAKVVEAIAHWVRRGDHYGVITSYDVLDGKWKEYL